MPERLGARGHQPEHGFFTFLVRSWLVGRDHQGRLADLACRVGIQPQHLGHRIFLAQEEPPEHTVIDRDVVAAADQDTSARPVHVDQVGRVELRHGGAVADDVARADRHAGGPEFTAEPGQQADDPASLGADLLGADLLRHRR